MNKKKTQKPSATKNIFIDRAKDKNVIGYFNYLEKGYEIFRHEKLILALKKSLHHDKCRNLLDIGCANGHLTNKVYKYFNFKKAIGVDFVPSLIDEAKTKYSHINFYQATLPKLKFKKNQFDLIVATEVLYYLKPETQVTTIKKIKNIMKKNSYILISSPNGKEYLTLGDIKNLLKNNFEIIYLEKLKMKYYQLLIKPFFLASRITQLLSNKKKPHTKKSKIIYYKAYPIISKFPIRQSIFLLNLLSKIIIKNKILPRLLNFICHFSNTTNTIIVAKVIK